MFGIGNNEKFSMHGILKEPNLTGLGLRLAIKMNKAVKRSQRISRLEWSLLLEVTSKGAI
jgi:hypothetical protein